MPGKGCVFVVDLPGLPRVIDIPARSGAAHCSGHGRCKATAARVAIHGDPARAQP
jgi:hypothetical protein